MKINTVILLAIAFILAGCNYELREIPKANENTETAQSNIETNAETDKKIGGMSQNSTEDDGIEGGELLISDTGTNAAYPCKNREVELDKDTTSNRITLTGICKKLVVDGVANEVSVEKVGQIVVRGISNKVIYESGIGGGKPKISVSGTSTSAKQKEAETEPENSGSDERKPKK